MANKNECCEKNECCTNGGQFYNLKYTHQQLTDLLKKIENGEVLTKEQYNKLINEIGLNNISTFDQDYYNLKNRPYIPVRLGDLFNDVGYDVKQRVDSEFELLRADLKREMDRIDSLKADLENIDIDDILKQIGAAQSQADYLSSDIRNLNGVIFSFEQAIELMQNKTAEISNGFEALMNMQERDELRLDNIGKTLEAHTEDLQSLLDYYEIEKNKLVDTINAVKELQNAVDLLEDYNGTMNNIDIRVSIIEEFLKALNPDEVDLEFLAGISEDLKQLQEGHKEFQNFRDSITNQINNLSQEAFNKITTIEGDLKLLKESSSQINSLIANNTETLASHGRDLQNLNDLLATLSNTSNNHDLDIEALLESNTNLSNKVNNLSQSIKTLVNKDSEHSLSINGLLNDLSTTQNKVLELDNAIKAGESELEQLKELLGSLESGDITVLLGKVEMNSREIEILNQTLNKAQNDIVKVNERADALSTEILDLSENMNTQYEQFSEELENLNSKINGLDGKFSVTEANLLTFQSRITELENAAESFTTEDTVIEIFKDLKLQSHVQAGDGGNSTIVVDLKLEDTLLSSVNIPYNGMAESEVVNKIARANYAITNYSITIAAINEEDEEEN